MDISGDMHDNVDSIAGNVIIDIIDIQNDSLQLK